MEQPMRDKKCPKCKAWRFKTQFIAKDREMKTCEICRDRGKKYIDKNRENKKQYDIKNKYKITETQKQYRIENRDKILEQIKQWRTDNPEHIKQYVEEQKKNNPLQTKFKNMICSSKSNDKKYNLPITEDYITLDYLNQLWGFQNGLCYYEDCQVVLDYESFDKNKRNDNLITIQRHDNNICHSQNNTCLSCFNCNVNKHKEREHFTEILIATNKLAVE